MSIIIKTHFGGDIRRITFPTKGTYSELITTLEKLYGEPGELVYQVRYSDDEGDLITVTNDLELTDAIVFTGSNILRLFIEKVKPSSFNFLNSWILLLSQTKQQIQEVLPTTKSQDVLEEFDILQKKIETCKIVKETIQSPVEPNNDNLLDSFVVLPAVAESKAVLYKEEFEATPTGPVTVKDIISLLSQDIAKDMISLSSRVAELISTQEEQLSSLKEELLCAADLANKTLEDVNSLSNTSAGLVGDDVASILKLVSTNSDSIISVLKGVYLDREHLAQLSSAISSECSSLSKATSNQCLSDAESIRAAIMNL